MATGKGWSHRPGGPAILVGTMMVFSMKVASSREKQT
jgi:hypothetical protein